MKTKSTTRSQSTAKGPGRPRKTTLNKRINARKPSPPPPLNLGRSNARNPPPPPPPNLRPVTRKPSPPKRLVARKPSPPKRATTRKPKPTVPRLSPGRKPPPSRHLETSRDTLTAMHQPIPGSPSHPPKSRRVQSHAARNFQTTRTSPTGFRIRIKNPSATKQPSPPLAPTPSQGNHQDAELSAIMEQIKQCEKINEKTIFNDFDSGLGFNMGLFVFFYGNFIAVRSVIRI